MSTAATMGGMGLQHQGNGNSAYDPPPPTVPAPPLMQATTQMASPLQSASRPMQTQGMHPQTMGHLQSVHSATAVPPPPMSTASAVVAQSSHYVMQQALSLQPEDMIKVYESLRKHLHSEGLLRGMSVSARTKRRVDCLKEGCPGCTPPLVLHVSTSAPAPRPLPVTTLHASLGISLSLRLRHRRDDGIQETGHVQRRQGLRLSRAVGVLCLPTGQVRLQAMRVLKCTAAGSSQAETSSASVCGRAALHLAARASTLPSLVEKQITHPLNIKRLLHMRMPVVLAILGAVHTLRQDGSVQNCCRRAGTA